MRRFLSSLALLLLAVPVWAVTRSTMQQVSGVTCTATACTATSAPYCLQGTTISACNTSTGFYEPIASTGVDSGTHLNLEGYSGNSYLVWDSTSHQIQVYVDGNLRARITPNGVIPGDCPSDPYTIEGGTECYDPTTGKRMTLDVRGLHEVGR